MREMFSIRLSEAKENRNEVYLRVKKDFIFLQEDKLPMFKPMCNFLYIDMSVLKIKKS